MSAREQSPEVEPEYLDAAGVAARIGVKRASLYAYLARGHAPEPDLVWLGRSLWLVSTIDEWREHLHERGRVRVPRRLKVRTTESSRRLPPKIAKGPRALDSNADRRPRISEAPTATPVSEAIAKQVAAALRGDGHHCTADDVLELAAAEVPRERERELLQRRIVAKLRGLRARASEGGRRLDSPAAADET